MTRKNRYSKIAKISESKFRELLRLLCIDLSAIQIAQITGLNRNTVNRYLRAIRERIAYIYESESPLSGEVEIDGSYFGAKRLKGKRGRRSGDKTIVFGVLKRNGAVYTEIVLDCSKPTV